MISFGEEKARRKEFTQRALRRETQEHRQECLCHTGEETREKAGGVKSPTGEILIGRQNVRNEEGSLRCAVWEALLQDLQA